MATTLNAGTATGGAAISADTTGILQLQSGSTPTTAVTIDTSQNVGIGTASPSSKLNAISTSSANNYLTTDIQNSAATSTIAFNNRLLRVASNASGADATIQFTDFTTYNAYIGLNGGNLLFGTNGPTERMRIDSSGNLLVGTTNSVPTGDGFSVYAAAGNFQTIIAHVSGTSNGTSYVNFRYNNSSIGSITQNGTTGVLYNITSDYRLKNDVKPIENGLSTIEALNPVSFNWIDGRPDDGFIAHELQAVIPNCVTGEKDAVNEDGTPKYQQMDNSGVIPFLVKAIQELKAEIDALKGVK